MIRQRANDAYLWVRRRVRRLLIDNPKFDGSVGNLLRKFEKRVVGLKVVQEQSRRAGGVVTAQGVQLHYREQDLGVVAPLLMHEDYEPETREVIERLLDPGMCFVDLGAHIGFLSLIAARRVGATGRVHAFEPVEETANMLAKNVAANQLDDVVDIVRHAISNEPKDLVFAISREQSVSNKMVSAAAEVDETITLRATSLDAYFGALDWPDVHLIKMDVEGAELDGMRGMRQLSVRNDDLKLIFEFHHANLLQMDITAEQLFDELSALGFTRFTRLYRTPTPIEIPDDIAENFALSEHINFNILCEKR